MSNLTNVIGQIKIKFPNIRWKLTEDPLGKKMILGLSQDSVYSCVENDEQQLIYSCYSFKKSKYYHSDSWGVFDET